MINFKSSKITHNYKTIGEQLREKRLEKGSSIKKISRKINIDDKYLKALEENNYHKLPKGLYCKKILKTYIDFLELDFEAINEIFLKEKSTIEEISKKNSFFSTKKIKWKDVIIFPKLGKSLVVITLVLVCFSYLGLCLQDIFAPPQLSILLPAQNNLITNEKDITINGITEPGTKIKINNKLVLNDRDGKFSQKINLRDGVNKVIIEASKKYGQKNIVQRQILVKELN